MIKDLTQYTYLELYDMLNHINPYKYEDRLEAVRLEVEQRKLRGEVPKRLVPEIDWEPLKFWKKRA